ncbi:hypothetical protein [Aureimonas psammosilenae]|uniref:hypothetical protein n=1 Tax=Aureimonas psammosilenae TaxID=2495496 RepID=UPI001260F970|nr:hypothetical protein [Aureimonas psammosilenae]
MSIALAKTVGAPDSRKELYANWLIGTFNARAFGLTSLLSGYGDLLWLPDGEGYRLMWSAPSGLTCHLARLYPQENDTWVTLVVAGVADDLPGAISAAEWAVSLLTAGGAR